MEDYSFLNNLTCFTDIHFHLDGSLSIENVKELAKINHIEIPSSDEELRKKIECDPNCNDLVTFLTKFSFPCSLLQTKESLLIATKNILKEAQTEGNIYIEIRFAPQLHCQKGLTIEDAVIAVIEGMRSSEIYCNLILCLMRGNDKSNYDANLETIKVAKKYFNNGVAGIDLAGAESLYPTYKFKNLFEIAKKENIPFTIHAGEADGPSSINDALNFGATRIGHGVRSIEDLNLLNKIKKDRVLLEVCPSSNIKTNIFNTYDEIPIKSLLKKGILICVNTDDKAIIGTNIRNEFYRICKAQKLSKKDIKKLLINSIENSFARHAIKEKIIDIINIQL